MANWPLRGSLAGPVVSPLPLKLAQELLNRSPINRYISGLEIALQVITHPLCPGAAIPLWVEWDHDMRMPLLPTRCRVGELAMEEYAEAPIVHTEAEEEQTAVSESSLHGVRY